MSERHKDGTLCECDGDGWKPPVFETRESCPICRQFRAAFCVEDAAMHLRSISASHHCPAAAGLAEQLRKIQRQIESLTWEPKGGAA